VGPIHRLVSGLIDYAGLFPPAGLTMTSAVSNYATYRSGEDCWALARFIVTASRLEEFENEMREILPGLTEDNPWLISALCGPALDHDLTGIEAFNSRHRTLQVDALEIKAATGEDVGAVAATVPNGLLAYFEVPLSPDPLPFIAAIQKAGVRAKIRTGGLREDMFPSVEEISRFLTLCCRHNVPFKATAGLHHPFCGMRRLTYDTDDRREVLMYGFLNVLLAAVFLCAGIRPELLAELLREPSPDAFTFDDCGVSWRHHWASHEQMEEVRAGFAIAFGSCSFDEPMRAMKQLNLL
jgi:hypothetical protein